MCALKLFNFKNFLCTLSEEGANYFGESRETSLPLALSKWALPDQEVISDTVILGTWTSSPLTHLITASVRGGYIAFYRHVYQSFS